MHARLGVQTQTRERSHRRGVTYLRVRKAAHISMAPQKETSPSPWLKCMSPILKLAPSMNTGKYTCVQHQTLVYMQKMQM